jgi:hypothetical protein
MGASDEPSGVAGRALAVKNARALPAVRGR